MKTRYIFTDSSLETIHSSFMVDNNTIHKTTVSDISEINNDKSVSKNVIFFNAEFLNSCSLNGYDKSDKAALLKAKFFSLHDDQLLQNPSELSFFSSFSDNIGIWGESKLIDELKNKTSHLRKCFFMPDYLIFFENKNVIANFGSHYSLRLADGRGYSGHAQKINALLKSNAEILKKLDAIDVSSEELEFLKDLDHSLNNLDLSSLVQKFHFHHSSSLNILKTPFNFNRLLSLDVISMADFRKFAILLLTTFLISFSINTTIESRYKSFSEQTRLLLSSLGNQSVRLINPKAQIDQLINGLKISNNQNYFDDRVLSLFDTFQVDELDKIEVNLDAKIAILYLDGLSSQKLNIIRNLLKSLGLQTEENFAQVQNQFNGSIKVYLND